MIGAKQERRYFGDNNNYTVTSQLHLNMRTIGKDNTLLPLSIFALNVS